MSDCIRQDEVHCFRLIRKISLWYFSPPTLPFHFLRRFFVLAFQFVFGHEIISQEFRRMCHFRNSDERRLRGQMSPRNNPAPSDGRQTPLVLSKMAHSETIYYSSTLCELRGQTRPIWLIFHSFSWLSFSRVLPFILSGTIGSLWADSFLCRVCPMSSRRVLRNPWEHYW